MSDETAWHDHQEEPGAGRDEWRFAGVRPSRPASKTAPAMAQGADDETARILGEYGTPEKLLGYLLMEAERHKRDAYSAARAQRETAGDTAAARQRYDTAYEAAHAGWTAEVAHVVAEYALRLDATGPAASSAADDLASPYNLGWRSGADMLVSEITRRPSDYDDGQWREYVAGYAKGIQHHAEATAAYARAVQERAQEATGTGAAWLTAASFSGPVQPSDHDAPDPQEMAAAYRAVYHTDAPWLTRQQWRAGQLSTATGTVLTAPWYLAAIAAKTDSRPMSAVPRYMAAADMDATAGRLRDYRDPSGPGDEARDVAEALSDAAAAMRAGDLAEARSALTGARGTITPGSSLHRILDDHERPVINLAGPARLSGPAASSARVTRRPSQQGQRHVRGR